jgi:hypothetical protein
MLQMPAHAVAQRYDSIPNAPTKSQSGIRDAITAMAFRRARVARWHDPTTSRDISRQAAAVVFPGHAAAPGSSGANSRCRRRYLRGCAIVFHRAISTSLPSRCQLRVIPKRSGLSYCLSPVLNRAAPRKAAFASRLYTHTHTYIGCVPGLFDGPKCTLQRMEKGWFQNGSRIALFRPCRRQKSKKLEQICTYRYLFTHQWAGGQIVRQESVSGRISFCSRRPVGIFGVLERAGAMSHTLDGSIDSASMRPKRTLSAIPRSSG